MIDRAPDIRLPLCKTLLIIIGLAILANPSDAQTVNATRAFDEGTRLLTQGDFRGAIEAYERAEEFGLGSGALFHNRAVAHYRLDEVGHAVQYLERAVRIEENDRFIQHSLDIVSTRLVDNFSELPLPVWKRLHRVVVGMVSDETQMVIGLGFYLIICLFVLMKLLGSWKGAWYRRIRVVSALAAVLFVGSALASSVWPAYPQEAVVIVDETILHEQPDSESRTLENVHEGLVLGVVSEGNGWVLVQLPNGARGWVPSFELGTI